MPLFWKKQQNVPPAITPGEGEEEKPEKSRMKYQLDPGIEGCEQGVVFFTNTGEEVLFLATTVSPAAKDSSIAIRQILLSAQMRRAAWYLQDKQLVANGDWLENLEALRLQQNLPLVEQFPEEEAFQVLAKLVQESIRSIGPRIERRAFSSTLPTLLSLLLRVRAALPSNGTPLT